MSDPELGGTIGASAAVGSIVAAALTAVVDHSLGPGTGVVPAAFVGAAVEEFVRVRHADWLRRGQQLVSVSATEARMSRRTNSWRC